MKPIILIYLFIQLIIHDVRSQLNSFYIVPNEIDSNYSISDDSTYISLNKAITTTNKLLLFLPGTGAKTKHYQLFPTLAANLGYHCISLSYPNGYPTVAMSCANNIDTNCYLNIREEVCYGNDVSSNVSVDSLNSIVTRLNKTILFLMTNYPDDGWGNFYTNNQIDWSKIIVSGHSQGSGHALYLAKTNSCDRLIMFAGADDYSNFYSSPANWTFSPSLTNTNQFYSLLHFNDDVWDYSKQFSVVEAVGMTTNDDSTDIDFLTQPFNNSKCLYTNITPNHSGIYSAYHNSMVVDYYTPLDNSNNPILEPVWNYILSNNGTNYLEIQKNDYTIIYPNPSNQTLHIESNFEISKIEILDLNGKIVYNKIENPSLQENINITDINQGYYFIKIYKENQYISIKSIQIKN